SARDTLARVGVVTFAASCVVAAAAGAGFGAAGLLTAGFVAVRVVDVEVLVGVLVDLAAGFAGVLGADDVVVFAGVTVAGVSGVDVVGLVVAVELAFVVCGA